ncbi:methyltransferase [Paenibacillus baekrokdamisoli]|uniref:Methyltransferase n=1 Tax=Paenibacillus baekrokdamisoli TaxID=1712516 RepID=A0A3G9JAN8_9BACL|nr:class I SAM-dependent methyltransferase [Paenibacillus baekrokdamisoli]MBB3071522.1 SAM-dependent methyltransferase [Paenibacillus baekrokdamisoli]BBH21963.1 methyltransferase [Paenibacillus baekrokdamisoli]
MEPYYWDSKIEYLKKSVSLYYNDDYIKFLVDTVWKINDPVHIIDFGCGFGHMGLRLLPLLPAGSKYTGIDEGVKLIDHAQNLFKDLPYDTEFILEDFNNVMFEKKYDIAVCHGVLLHMTDPTLLLKKMIDSVKSKGKVIAFEPHWIGNNASFHFEGIEQSSVIPLGQLQELFERDEKRTGKDGNIGLKLPLYLNRLGLHEVQCRVSDKVNIYDPKVDSEKASTIYEAMQFSDPGDRESYINALLDRGMLIEEAERQYEAEKNLSLTFTSSLAATYAAGMKITFGTVE